MKEIEEWIPQDRKVILAGDTEYACRELVRGLPERIVFVGPMHMDAALYHPPPPKKEGGGRPRVKGKRRLSPRQLIAAGTPSEPPPGRGRRNFGPKMFLPLSSDQKEGEVRWGLRK